MKSSSVTATWLLCLALAAGATAETGLANPWEETTADALARFPGVTFGVPEGAEDIEYRLLRKDALAEMQFTWYDLRYCARISRHNACDRGVGRPFDMYVALALAPVQIRFFFDCFQSHSVTPFHPISYILYHIFAL